MDAVADISNAHDKDLRQATVEVRNLQKRFGDVRVLNGIDLDVHKGEVVAVIGPSGGGKSTLLRCINFLETYDGGSIKLDGVEVGYRDAVSRQRRPEKELSALRAETAMVFQSFHLFPHLTAIQNITLGLEKVRKLSPARAREKARHWLANVNLEDKADRLPSQLSGGQQQRVGIARAVAMDPKVLLLDEITSALDPELVGEVLEVVGNLAANGMTMLLVTHEMEFARDVADRACFVEDGKVLIDGPAADVLDNPENARLKSFLRRVLPKPRH